MAKYEVDRFESPPDPDLICCICQCVLYKPLESPCQHVFCKVCIETWLTNRKNCPNCRKSLRASKLKPVLPIVRNMINRLLIKCDNRSRGCRERIKLEYYDTHVKECGFVPLKCMNTGCDTTVLRKDMLDHEKQCQYRLVVCKKGCGLPIAADQERSHNCIAVLKENIKAIEESHSKRYKALWESFQKIEKKVNNLEEQVELILTSNEGNRDYSDYESSRATPTNEEINDLLAEGDYHVEGTPGYYEEYSPTSEEIEFQDDPTHEDSYGSGRETPINREDQESNWSWLNEDENDNDQWSNNGDEDLGESTEEALLASDDEGDHSEGNSSQRNDQEHADEHSNGSSVEPVDVHSSPELERAASRSPARNSSQTERPRHYSLRSSNTRDTPDGVSESDDQILASSSQNSASGTARSSDGTVRTSDDAPSSRREQHVHTSDTTQTESPSSSSTSSVVPVIQLLERVTELDTGSDRTWSPSNTPAAQQQASRGQQAATSSNSNRGTSGNTTRRSEASRRSEQSSSREESGRRRRGDHRRRSRDYYSSDEDRDHRGSKHSSGKRARRR